MTDHRYHARTFERYTLPGERRPRAPEPCGDWLEVWERRKTDWRVLWGFLAGCVLWLALIVFWAAVAHG